MAFNGSFLRRSLKLTLLLTLFCGVFLIPHAEAQPLLLVKVGDTTAASGEVNSVISVFLDNYQDTVAGFNIWLKLGNPYIMSFQTNDSTVIDTTYWKCIEYDGLECVNYIPSNPLDNDSISIDTNDVKIGSWDTTGTLISGWASVDARSISGLGTDLNIYGIAYSQQQPDIPGILPGNHGQIPLVKLLADVNVIEDTAQERDVSIFIEYHFIDHFSFSRPNGSLIGLAYDTILDTNFYLCTQWIGDECHSWQKVSQPPADSMEEVLKYLPYVDTTRVFVDHGSLTVLGGTFCGDVDGDGEGMNVADIVYGVNYLFRGGPPPPYIWTADVNCEDPDINVADLVYMVNFLFKGGPAPCTAPSCN